MSAEMNQDCRKDIDKTWEMIKEIGESERHFNQLEHQYRVLASTWLLGVFVAVGFLLTSEFEFFIPTEFLIAIVAFFGAVGITLLWHLDLIVYHQLLASYFHAGLKLENDTCWLPKIRNDMLTRLGDKGAAPLIAWFYIVGNAVVLIVGVVSLTIWLLTHNGATPGDYAIVVLAALVSSVWIWLIHYRTGKTLPETDKNKQA